MNINANKVMALLLTIIPISTFLSIGANKIMILFIITLILNVIKLNKKSSFLIGIILIFTCINYIKAQDYINYGFETLSKTTVNGYSFTIVIISGCLYLFCDFNFVRELYINIKGYISFYAGNPQFTSNAVVSKLDEPVPDYINIDNLPDLTIDEEYISNVIEDWKNNYRHPGGVYGTIEATLTKDKYYSLSVGGSTVSLSPFTPTQEDAELYDQSLGKNAYCAVASMHVIHEKAIQVVVLSMNVVDEG